MIRYLVVLLLFFNPVFADSGHCTKHNPCQGEQGPVGPQGIPGVDGKDGVAGVNALDTTTLNNQTSEINTRLDRGMASAIALSNIDFSSSTKAWQVGLAVGTYDGEQAMAFGTGKLITKYDMLFKASGTVANDEYGVGVGLMWKIQ